MSIFSHFQQRFESTRQEELSLQEYLELCKTDRSAYASAAERLLMAIGEPELFDTSTNSRLSRIFSNKVIRRYPAFEDFHGMEDCIEQIVSYFRHAAQGLEEKKQILYLLGPVGGGKSSLAEKLKQLVEKVPFYAIKGSPVFESPLGLFNPPKTGQSSKRTSASRALPQHHHVAMGDQTSGRVRGRHQPVQGGETLPVDPQPDRRSQNRTG
jgi:serine protein kinase